MKNFLKLLLLGAFLFTGIAEAQALRFPKNVRFIAGGYLTSPAKPPYFGTLEGALNDVKAAATSSNPYVFWVDGDTLWIPDWDSVFTESGLTMKDSIDQHYVSAGKIKWAGFGFGGTGGEGGNITTQDDATLHYNYPNWDQTNVALQPWQRESGKALDSIDQDIWDLIVYINSDSALFIRNDTLYIDFDMLADSLANYGLGGGAPYVAGYLHKDTAITVTATHTYTGRVTFTGAGRLNIPSAQTGGQAREIWISGDSLYMSTSGAEARPLANVNWVEDNFATLAQVKAEIKQPHSFLTDAAYTPAIATGGTYVKFTPGWTTEEAINMTVAGDTITINSGYDGDYFMIMTMTVTSAATDDYTLQIRLNNVAHHTCRFTGQGAAEYFTVTTMGYFPTLVAGDDISMYITNTVDADDPVISELALRILREHEAD